MTYLRSWGRHFTYPHHKVIWDGNPDRIKDTSSPLLPYGNGNSYGDVCLNEGGTSIITTNKTALLDFDHTTGVLEVESGASLYQVLNTVLPAGWSLPVLPGTGLVTIGGAIANDVHGKNHMTRGTIGRHIRSLQLLRSDGHSLTCSPQTDQSLFSATIGGLGLTGLITSATLQLVRAPSAAFNVRREPFRTLEEGLHTLTVDLPQWEHRVAWLDPARMRGITFMGQHASADTASNEVLGPGGFAAWNLPFPVFNGMTVPCLNWLLFHKGALSKRTSTQSFTSFNFPIDKLRESYRLFGPKGLVQAHVVLPMGQEDKLTELCRLAANNAQLPAMVGLKRFGELSSPGMLSFPIDGYAIALDYVNQGPSTFAQISRLYDLAIKCGGRVYPAKDSCLSPEQFRSQFPNWQQLVAHLDPRFASSFQRRVGLMGDLKAASSI